MKNNTILNETEEQQLRDYFNLKVRPRYKPKTITTIINAINKIRTGEMKETEFVNPNTKILDWQSMLENWGLYPKFVQLK